MPKANIFAYLFMGLVFLAGGFAYLNGTMGSVTKPSTTLPGYPSAPARFLEVGPYGTNVRTTFSVGNLSISLKASKLYLKKSRTLGFSNALLKKMVARNLDLVVKRDGMVILSLTKAYQEMPADMNTFRIDHPQLRYPIDMAPPDRVLLEKDSQQAILWYGTKKQVWDLSS